MLHQILERVMKKAYSAQVFISRSEEVPVLFQDDKLKSIKVEQSTDIELRVIVEGKEGHSSTSDPDDIDGLVERALEAAKFGSNVHFDFPGPQKAADVKLYDHALRSMTKEEMVQIGEEMLTLIKEYNPNIVFYAEIYKGISNIEFINSKGLEFSTDASIFGIGCSGVLVRGTDILEIDYGQHWRKQNSIVDPVKVANRIIDKFQLAERTATIKSKEMPVIFKPESLDVLLLALKLGFNGKNVLLGASPLAGKLGSIIFDNRFTLIDNPMIDYAPESGIYDGEGIPHRTNTLVENGAIKGFLYDLDAAGRAGTKSTGNGPGCEMTNLVIPEGSGNYSDMIRNTSEGLLVDDVMGLGQSNIMNGDFSVNVNLGYKIENGEIVGRVKDTMLAGNAYSALANIIAIGDESEWVSGSIKTPPIHIVKLSVVTNT